MGRPDDDPFLRRKNRSRSRPRRRTAGPLRTRRLHFEGLEDRRLLAFTPMLAGGVFTLTASGGGNDNLIVDLDSGGLGQFTFDDQNDPGPVVSFATGTVNRIIIDLNDLDDMVEVIGTTTGLQSLEIIGGLGSSDVSRIGAFGLTLISGTSFTVMAEDISQLGGLTAPAGSPLFLSANAGNINLTHVSNDFAGGFTVLNSGTVTAFSSGTNFLIQSITAAISVDLSSAGSLVGAPGMTNVLTDALTLTARGLIDLDTEVNQLTASLTAPNAASLVKVDELSGLGGLNVNAGPGMVDLTFGNMLNDVDPGIDVAAGSATVKFGPAVADFGTMSSPIHTAVASLTIDTSASGGSQFIDEADALADLLLTAGLGNVFLKADGNLLDPDPAVDITASLARIRLPDTDDSGDDFGDAASPIHTAVGNLMVDTAADAVPGDQFITEFNGLSNLNLNAGMGNVTLVLTPGLTILAPPGFAINDQDTFTVSDGTLLRTFEFDNSGSVVLGNLPVPFNTPDSNLMVARAVEQAVFNSPLSVQAVRQGAQVTLVGATQVAPVGLPISFVVGETGSLADPALDGDDLVAANASLRLNATLPRHVGDLANPLETNVGSLSVNTSAGNGNQFLREANALTIAGNDLDAGTGIVNLTAGSFRTSAGGSILSNTIVGSGATLGGTGAVNGTVTVRNAGAVSPGNGPGCLATGDVVLEIGANFNVELDGAMPCTQFDQLQSSGNVVLGGAMLSLSGTHAPVAGESFPLLMAAGTLNGTFADLPDGSMRLFNLQPVELTYTAAAPGSVTLAFDPTPVINGDRGNNLFEVREDTSGNIEVLIDGLLVMDTPRSSLVNLTINGGDNDDSLNIDYTSGGFFNLPITFNGEAGSDSLTLTGGSFSTVTYNYTGVGSGDIIQGGATIAYSGLEPITNTGTAIDLVFNLPVGGSDAVLEDDGTAGNSLSRFLSANGTFELTDFMNPTGSLRINRGDAADTFTTNPLPEFDASLMIGSPGVPLATVTFTDAVTLAGNKNLFVDASGTIRLSTSSSDISAKGTGMVNLTTAQNIAFAPGASITSDAGTIALGANQQTPSSSGNFVGIDVNGATLDSATGSVRLFGRGGDTGSGNHGVRVGNGALVSGDNVVVTGRGGSGSGRIHGVLVDSPGTITSSGGPVTVTGFGGAGADHCYGVYVTDGTIDSGGGNVQVTGTGSSSAANDNYGVYVEFTGQITAGQGGQVSVDGFGGAGPQGNGFGVRVGRGGMIASSDGNVRVMGTGANSAGGGDAGIELDLSGQITAGGVGTVTVIGNGNGTGNGNFGIWLSDSAAITSSGGNLLVTGTGGNGGNSNAGVFLQTRGVIAGVGGASVTVVGTGDGAGTNNEGLFITDANTQITAFDGLLTVTGIPVAGSNGIGLANSAQLATLGTGDILAISDSLDVAAGTAITAGSSATETVTLRQSTNGTAIDLGGADAAGVLGLTDAELDQIAARTINVGDANSGPITISDAITRTAITHLNVTTGGNNSITFTGGVPSGFLDPAGGDVSLATSAGGSGGVVSGAAVTDLANVGTLAITAGSGGIGAPANPLAFDAANLNTATGGNGSQFLGEADEVTIAAAGLTAGTGTIEFTGGTFTLGGSERVNNATDVSISGAATFDLGANLETIDQLILVNGSVTGVGPLVGGSTFDLRMGSIDAGLAGAGIGLTKTTSATVTLGGDVNSYSGITTVAAGTLSLVNTTTNNNLASTPAVLVSGDATLDVTGLDTAPTSDTLILANGQTLAGSGIVSGKVFAVSGSAIAPGPGAGILSTGNVTFEAGATFMVDVNGSTPGTQHDQLDVTGLVSLPGATLLLSGAITSSPGQQIVLIQNDLVEAVSGTFNGLGEGASVALNGVNFVISYVGGAGGNDVTLTQLGPVLYTSDGRGANALELRLVGSSVQWVDDGAIVDARPLSTLLNQTVTVNGTNGQSETLFVNFTLTAPASGVFDVDIDFHGGTGAADNDQLRINGGTFSTATHTFTATGPENSGNIVYTGLGSATITYDGLEPVDMTGSTITDLVFNLPAGGNAALLEDDGVGGNGTSQLRSGSNTFETTTFTNPTGSLTINGGAGIDAVTVTSLPDFNAALTIDGLAGADSITLSNAISLGSATSSGNLSFTAETINLAASLATDGDTLNNDAGNISLTGTTININANLTLDTNAATTDGTLTLSGAVAAPAATLSLDVGTTNLSLANAGNDFSIVSITSGNNVTLVDTNAIDLGASAVSGTLGVTAGGAITDSGALVVTGTATFAAGAANDITLNTATNNFSVVAITSGNNVTLVDTNAIDLGAAAVSGTLGVTAGGAITNSAALLVAGTATFAAGAANDITLNTATNNFSVVAITSGNNVTLVDTNAIDLGAAAVSGTLGVTAGGAITNSAALLVTGTATFAAGAANDITLNTATNNFSTVAITSGNNVTLVDTNAIDLGAAAVSGTLGVTAGGAITDSGALLVTGTATFAAGAANDITLNTATNNFSVVSITSGNNVTLVDANAIDLGTSAVSGTLGVTAGGPITDSAALLVAGTATFAAGAANDITLNTATNNFSVVSITSGNNVTLVDANAIDLGTSAVSGTLGVTAGGAITDSGALLVTGTATFAAGAANDITLNTATNNFSVVSITSGNNVTLVDTNAIDLGASAVSGTLGVTAGGTITDSAALVVAGTATFAAGAANDITLNTATNNFSVVSITSGNNVVLVDTNAIDLGAAAVSGTLGVTAGGPITDSAALLVAGTATFAAGAANDITLNTATNNFSMVSITSGNNVTLVDTNAIDLGAAAVSGTLGVTAGGTITDPAGTSLTVTNNASFSGVAITLGDNTADTTNFGSLTFTSAGAVSITEDSATAFAATSSGTTITVNSAGAITDAEVDAANEITGTSLTLTASGGVGAAGQPLHVDVTNLDVSNATAGGIFVTDTAGGLVLADLGGPNANAVNGLGGGGEIRAASPLTIAANATTTGGMTYTASDSAAAGDDLTVNAGVIVQDTTATLTLNAGDDMLLNATATVSAATTLSLNGDTGGAIDAAGSTLTLAANFSGVGATPIVVNGNVNNDQFNLADGNNTLENIGANVQLNGGGGTDALSLNDSGDATGDGTLALPVTISNDGAGDGTVTRLIDASAARTIEFNGLTGVSLQTGNTQADVVQVTPNANVTINLDGNNPTTAPGDTLLFITPAGQSAANSPSGPSSGVISTTGGFQNVNFVEFESISITSNAPVVTTTPAPLTYTENDPATIIDGALTVVDADSANLTGATASITAGFAPAEDVLAFNNQFGITGSFAATGILTLVGSASVANYQTALRSITYRNTSNAPSPTPRTITFTATDGTFNGSALRAINIVAVNDPPVAGNDSATTVENTAVTIAVLANDSDPDGGAPSVLSATNGAKGTTMVNAIGMITYTPNANATGPDSFTYILSDGQGGTATGTVAVAITAATAPVVIGTGGPDTLILRRNVADTEFEFTLNGGPAVAIGNPLTFTFNGRAGDDVMIVNINGRALPPGGVFFDGEAPVGLPGDNEPVITPGRGDVLQVVGTGAESAVYLPSATTPGAGTVTVTPAGTINFTGLEPVDISGMATVDVNFPNVGNAVLISNGFDGATGTLPALVVAGSSGGVPFESVHLRNNVTVNINGRDGSDTFTIGGGNNAHGNTNLAIDTGAVRATGSLTVTGNLNVFGQAITLNDSTLTAGVANLFGQVVTMSSSSQVVATIGDISIQGVLGVQLGSVQTGGNVTVVSQGGIAGAAGVPGRHLIANSATLSAGTSIGTAIVTGGQMSFRQPLVTAIVNLIADAAGLGIVLDNQGPLNIVQANAPFGLPYGVVDIQTFSPLTVSGQVLAGVVRLTASESGDGGPADDILTLAPGATVRATRGGVTLSAGDRLDVGQGASVSAATSIVWMVDGVSYSSLAASGATLSGASGPATPKLSRSLNAYHNPFNAHDVNDDNRLTSLDALLVINYLNRSGSVDLSRLTESLDQFYDVTGDSRITPHDALSVVGRLNAQFAEAEAEPIAEPASAAPIGIPTPSRLNRVVLASGVSSVRQEPASGSPPRASARLDAKLPGECLLFAEWSAELDDLLDELAVDVARAVENGID